jgi:hypothetical protein
MSQTPLKILCNTKLQISFEFFQVYTSRWLWLCSRQQVHTQASTERGRHQQNEKAIKSGEGRRNVPNRTQHF